MNEELNEYYKRREQKNDDLVICLCWLWFFMGIVIVGFSIYEAVKK